jgi:8-oxo-dGTP pyrophosphatase MutT (NUDIX family)
LSKPIEDAATLVLAREARQGFEVFLSKRTSKAAFMANAYVYPGGRVDPEDYEESLPLVPSGLESAFEDIADAARYRAHLVALLRECFEEAGVLLAARRDGVPLKTSGRCMVERLARHRARLNASECTFADILDAEALVLLVEHVHYFAHWITPPFENRRYDTRFFLAIAPEGQEPVPDYSEMVHGAWFSPASALDAYRDGSIQLAPPTLCTLEDLAESSTLEEAVGWARAQTPSPILPRLETIDDQMNLLLPGDPLYPSEVPVKGPTRIVLRDGRFVRQNPPTAL